MDYSEWKNYWFNLVQKCSKDGYNSLSPDERMWYNIRVLIDSINNGGIMSYYINSGADNLEDTINDLSMINAIEVRGLIEKCNQLFPNGTPSPDINERNDFIESIEDDDGAIEELLERLDNSFRSLENDLELKLEKVVERVIIKSK